MTNSFFESLKNLRFSYRLLLSIYSAILVFVISPDARKPLDEAIAELTDFLRPDSPAALDLKHFHERRADAWSTSDGVAKSLKDLSPLGVIQESAREWVVGKIVPEALGDITDYYLSTEAVVGFLPKASEARDLAASLLDRNGQLVPITGRSADDSGAALRQAEEKVRRAVKGDGPSVKELEAQLVPLESAFQQRSNGYPLQSGCDRLRQSAEESLLPECLKIVALVDQITSAKLVAQEAVRGEKERIEAVAEARRILMTDLPPRPAEGGSRSAPRGLEGDIKYFAFIENSGIPHVLAAERVVTRSTPRDRLKLPPEAKILPAVQALDEWDTIAKRRAEAVRQFLQVRSRAQGRSVSLLGFTVHQDVVIVVGSIAMLVMLLYFILNGQHLLNHWSPKINSEMREFPWVGFFIGRQNLVVIWFSLAGAPTAFLLWATWTQLAHVEDAQYWLLSTPEDPPAQRTTPEKAQECARSCPWPEGSAGNSILSSKRKRCASPASAIAASSRSPRIST